MHAIHAYCGWRPRSFARRRAVPCLALKWAIRRKHSPQHINYTLGFVPNELRSRHSLHSLTVGSESMTGVPVPPRDTILRLALVLITKSVLY